MISKETFCKTLRMILEQTETDHQFSEALNLVGDHFDSIDWRLYEGAPDYLVWTDDGQKNGV